MAANRRATGRVTDDPLVDAVEGVPLVVVTGALVVVGAAVVFVVTGSLVVVVGC